MEVKDNLTVEMPINMCPSAKKFLTLQTYYEYMPERFKKRRSL